MKTHECVHRIEILLFRSCAYDMNGVAYLLGHWYQLHCINLIFIQPISHYARHSFMTFYGFCEMPLKCGNQMASLMKPLAVRILILLEISLFLTSAMATDFSSGFGRNHRYCGRVLTESLALICDGEYGGLLPPSHKRSGNAWTSYSLNLIFNRVFCTECSYFCDCILRTQIILHLISDESMDEEAYTDQMSPIMDEIPLQYQTYAYLSKLLPDVTDLKPRSRRDWMLPRRGVYDECCRKPCSVQELKSYCKRKN